VARSYLLLAAGLTATKTKELNMKDTPNETDSGAVDPFFAELRAVVGSWPPTAEEMERLKAERAELEFQSTKRRLENQDRKMVALKQATRRKLKVEISDE
jgi:hypothetical protein